MVILVIVVKAHHNSSQKRGKEESEDLVAALWSDVWQSKKRSSFNDCVKA